MNWFDRFTNKVLDQLERLLITLVMAGSVVFIAVLVWRFLNPIALEYWLVLNKTALD